MQGDAVEHRVRQTLTHVIVDGVVVHFPQLVDVEVQLDLAQDALHHGHQDLLVSVTSTWKTYVSTYIKMTACSGFHNEWSNI